MELGLIIFVLIIASYVASLIYLNSKVRLTRSKQHEFTEANSQDLTSLATVGLRIWLAIVLLLLGSLIFAIIFADELT